VFNAQLECRDLHKCDDKEYVGGNDHVIRKRRRPYSKIRVKTHIRQFESRAVKSKVTAVEIETMDGNTPSRLLSFESRFDMVANA
jgi:hypothetical protein